MLLVRHAGRAGTALALVLGLGIGATSRSGAISTTPRARAGSVRPADDFEAASRDEQVAVAAVERARAHRQETQAALAAADREVAAVTAHAEAATADLRRLDQARRNVVAQLARARSRAERARERARATAAVLYRSAGGGTPLVAIGDAGGRSRATRGAEYLRRAGQLLFERVDGLHVAEVDVRAAERALRMRRKTAARAAATVRRQLADVAARRSAQAQLVASAEADESRVQAVLADAQRRRTEFERAAAANAAASNAVADRLRDGSGDRSGRPGARLRFPADGPISSRFGMRMHPIFHTMRMHTGIDIGAAFGSPVRAASDGTVVVAGVITGYGNAVVVDHDGGLATLYGHLSRFAVRAGAHVGGGQVIGAVGNTGNSTGPHLHFEVRLNGTPVDPIPYL